jgi:hypothetical protein
MGCSYETCTNQVHHARGKYAGLCKGHKWQMQERGELSELKVRPAFSKVPLEDRFLARVEKTDTCWLWTGGQVEGGYGCVSVNGKTQRSHRVAYELWVAPLASHSVVHHTCSVRLCVNPAHLQAVTAQENVAEMLERQHYLTRIQELETKLEEASAKKKGWFRRAK